jgi:uncharacterized protein (UPF0332 family)
VTIDWCFKQRNGIKIITINDNLADEYIRTAEETLDVLKSIKGKSKVWLATTKYYCKYFAVYALLMKIGIKCEIHECTIELTKYLAEKDIIPLEFYESLKKDKKLRIDNQYYLKNREVDVDYNSLLIYVLRIKDIINTISIEKINNLRSEIKL